MAEFSLSTAFEDEAGTAYGIGVGTDDDGSWNVSLGSDTTPDEAPAETTPAVVANDLLKRYGLPVGVALAGLVVVALLTSGGRS